MPEVSPALRERARKTETVLRNQLAEIGQARVAERLGVSESTISRWKADQIESLAQQLTALGLKVVPLDANLLTTDEVTAMRTLAMVGLRSMEKKERS